MSEPAVVAGGPLREFFYLLLHEVQENNTLLCGPRTSRSLTHNVMHLEKMTYYYIGVFLALSIVHGGPAPKFFSSAVADYIVYGVKKVKAEICDVTDVAIQKSLQKVAIISVAYLTPDQLVMRQMCMALIPAWYIEEAGN